MRDEDLSFFEEPEFKISLARYENMLRSGESVYLDADELTDIAEYYAVNGYEEKAYKAIDYALTLHPGDPDPLIFKARQAMVKGNLEEALRIRNEVKDENYREAHFFDAEIMIRKGNPEQASEYLWNLRAGEEDDFALYCYDCAGVFLDYSCYEPALQWAERMHKEAPEDTRALLYIAEAYLQSERGEEAIAPLNKVLDSNPFSLKAWNFLAEAHFMSGQYEQAIDAADYALAINVHDDHALLMQANCHYQLGHNAEAHRLYSQYIDEHEADELVYMFDGICLTALEKYKEALDRLETAELMSTPSTPDLEQLYLQLSFVRSKLGMKDAAQKALLRACEVTDEESDLSYELIYGHILLENGDYKLAVEQFSQALTKAPDLLQTEIYVAVSLLDNGYMEDAISYLLHVLTNDEEGLGRTTYSYLAYCFLANKDEENYLYFLKLAGEYDKETALAIFGETFPGVQPEEYYAYAYKQLRGSFPKDL